MGTIRLGDAFGVDALRAAVDDWLAQMVAPFSNVGTLLAAPGGHDVVKVREVLRALWVVLGHGAGDARATLA
jgi:hypothetical protein